MGGTFGHWMGYENAGGAVWLGTKQDLVVRQTLLLTLKQTLLTFGQTTTYKHWQILLTLAHLLTLLTDKVYTTEAVHTIHS